MITTKSPQGQWVNFHLQNDMIYNSNKLFWSLLLIHLLLRWKYTEKIWSSEWVFPVDKNILMIFFVTEITISLVDNWTILAHYHTFWIMPKICQNWVRIGPALPTRDLFWASSGTLCHVYWDAFVQWGEREIKFTSLLGDSLQWGGHLVSKALFVTQLVCVVKTTITEIAEALN